MCWFANLDPRVIQGVLTLFAAIVGSGTALWIAYRAYPRQKAKDREHKLAEEKRHAYTGFFKAAEAFSTKLNFLFHRGIDSHPTAEEFFALGAAMDDLAIRASADGFEACSKYVTALAEKRTQIVKWLTRGDRPEDWNVLAESLASLRIQAIVSANADTGITSFETRKMELLKSYYQLRNDWNLLAEEIEKKR